MSQKPWHIFVTRIRKGGKKWEREEGMRFFCVVWDNFQSMFSRLVSSPLSLSKLKTGLRNTASYLRDVLFSLWSHLRCSSWIWVGREEMRGVMCSDEEPVSGTSVPQKAGTQWTLRLWTLSPGWWALSTISQDGGGRWERRRKRGDWGRSKERKGKKIRTKERRKRQMEGKLEYSSILTSSLY